jgi:chloramphenicol 3-O-phosphotransferase
VGKRTTGIETEIVGRLLGAGSVEALRHGGVVAPVADAAQIHADLEPLRAAPALDVLESRRNGNRIDVRLGTTDERAWLLVIWLVDGSEALAESVTVYERPDRYESELGLVIVLNGPSSVGKSALMSAFADSAATPFACLDEPVFGRLPTKFLAWPDTIPGHREGVLAALATAARRGHQFITSAAGIPQAEFHAALRDVRTVYVGLDAPLDVLNRRQLLQADKFGGLAEESIAIHDGWRYDLRIDTARHSPQEAARILSGHLEARASSPS